MCFSYQKNVFCYLKMCIFLHFLGSNASGLVVEELITSLTLPSTMPWSPVTQRRLELAKPPLNATEEWHERTKKRLHEAEQAEETSGNLKRQRRGPVIIKPDSSESEPESEPEPEPEPEPQPEPEPKAQPPPEPAHNSQPSGMQPQDVIWKQFRTVQAENERLNGKVKRLQHRCEQLERALEDPTPRCISCLADEHLLELPEVGIVCYLCWNETVRVEILREVIQAVHAAMRARLN